MKDGQKNNIEMEIRIRILENIVNKIERRLDQIDQKMDNQFKWIICVFITMISEVILSKII